MRAARLQRVVEDRHDALLKLGERKPFGQLRHIIARIVGQPDPHRLRRHARNHALAQRLGFAFRLADNGAAGPENPDLLRITLRIDGMTLVLQSSPLNREPLVAT